MIHVKRDNYIDKSKDEILDDLEDALNEADRFKKEKEALEKELRKYKNENTPSSANKNLKPDTQGLQKKTGSKRGAPKGHKGTTRTQSPTSTEVVDCDECPNCQGHDLEDKQVFNRLVEDIPEPVIPTTKHVEIHMKKCSSCGFTFIPPQNTTPLKGKFGINLMVLVIFLKFLLRGVLRKTTQFLNAGFMFKITPASVNAIIHRVAQAANNEYEALKLKIRNADTVYVDETSFSVLGKNQWCWVFRTKNDILLVIRPSRGNNVLEEILGKEYSGTVICDCWRAYNYLENAKLQRCWSHLLRKSQDLCDFVAGKHFHEKLQALFKEVKEFNSKTTTQKQREKKYDELTNKLEKTMTYYSQYEEFEGVAKYIGFNLKNWFTCVLVENVEPTNNYAEQAIRETVMVRKIIGAFRSEQGKESYETLASLIASWQMIDADLKTELKRMLSKNLCFC